MSIASAKESLVEALEETGYEVLDYFPENIMPPKICLVPGEPYITPGSTFRSTDANVNIGVILVSKTKKNQWMSADLDRMIEKVILNLGPEWSFEVSQPGYGVINNTYRLVCTVNVSSNFNLEG